MPSIVPLSAVDPQLVEDLLDAAFEPERRQRTSYRIREDDVDRYLAQRCVRVG